MLEPVGGTKGELILGDSLDAGEEDTLLGTTSASEGGNGELGDLSQTRIISEGADLDADLGVSLERVSGFFNDPSKGEGCGVTFREREDWRTAYDLEQP